MEKGTGRGRMRRGRRCGARREEVCRARREEVWASDEESTRVFEGKEAHCAVGRLLAWVGTGGTADRIALLHSGDSQEDGIILDASAVERAEDGVCRTGASNLWRLATSE